MEHPVTAQPSAGAGQVDPFAPGAPGSGGPVTIRNLTNTREDCAFAGRLTVEAFSVEDGFMQLANEGKHITAVLFIS